MSLCIDKMSQTSVYAQLVMQNMKALENKNKRLQNEIEECKEELARLRVDNDRLQSIARAESLDRTYSAPSPVQKQRNVSSSPSSTGTYRY